MSNKLVPLTADSKSATSDGSGGNTKLTDPLIFRRGLDQNTGGSLVSGAIEDYPPVFWSTSRINNYSTVGLDIMLSANNDWWLLAPGTYGFSLNFSARPDDWELIPNGATWTCTVEYTSNGLHSQSVSGGFGEFDFPDRPTMQTNFNFPVYPTDVNPEESSTSGLIKFTVTTSVDIGTPMFWSGEYTVRYLSTKIDTTDIEEVMWLGCKWTLPDSDLSYYAIDSNSGGFFNSANALLALGYGTPTGTPFNLGNDNFGFWEPFLKANAGITAVRNAVEFWTDIYPFPDYYAGFNEHFTGGVRFGNAEFANMNASNFSTGVPLSSTTPPRFSNDPTLTAFYPYWLRMEGATGGPSHQYNPGRAAGPGNSKWSEDFPTSTVVAGYGPEGFDGDTRVGPNLEDFILRFGESGWIQNIEHGEPGGFVAIPEGVIAVDASYNGIAGFREVPYGVLVSAEKLLIYHVDDIVSVTFGNEVALAVAGWNFQYIMNLSSTTMVLLYSHSTDHTTGVAVVTRSGNTISHSGIVQTVFGNWGNGLVGIDSNTFLFCGFDGFFDPWSTDTTTFKFCDASGSLISSSHYTGNLSSIFHAANGLLYAVFSGFFSVHVNVYSYNVGSGAITGIGGADSDLIFIICGLKDQPAFSSYTQNGDRFEVNYWNGTTIKSSINNLFDGSDPNDMGFYHRIFNFGVEPAEAVTPAIMNVFGNSIDPCTGPPPTAGGNFMIDVHWVASETNADIITRPYSMGPWQMPDIFQTFPSVGVSFAWHGGTLGSTFANTRFYTNAYTAFLVPLDWSTLL